MTTPGRCDTTHTVHDIVPMLCDHVKCIGMLSQPVKQSHTVPGRVRLAHRFRCWVHAPRVLPERKCERFIGTEHQHPQ
jgi:hypothetical protein